MIVNIERREYLHPHKFDEGLKLMEFAHSSGSILTGLAVLLAGSNGRGGGDFRAANEADRKLVGSWCGDRIAIVGDYEEIGDVHGVKEPCYPHHDGDDGRSWKDISPEVVAMLKRAGEWKR